MRVLCALDRFARSAIRAALLVDRSPAQQSVDSPTVDRSRTASPAQMADCCTITRLMRYWAIRQKRSTIGR